MLLLCNGLYLLTTIVKSVTLLRKIFDIPVFNEVCNKLVVRNMYLHFLAAEGCRLLTACLGLHSVMCLSGDEWLCISKLTTDFIDTRSLEGLNKLYIDTGKEKND